jgi:hypothetical protein
MLSADALVTVGQKQQVNLELRPSLKQLHYFY